MARRVKKAAAGADVKPKAPPVDAEAGAEEPAAADLPEMAGAGKSGTSDDASGKPATDAPQSPRPPETKPDGPDVSAKAADGSKPSVAPEEAESRSARTEPQEEPSHIRITAKQDGFRRCGIAHGKAGVIHPVGRFTDGELRTLRADPNLTVEAAAPPEAPKATSAEDENARMRDFLIEVAAAMRTGTRRFELVATGVGENGTQVGRKIDVTQPIEGQIAAAESGS